MNGSFERLDLDIWGPRRHLGSDLGRVVGEHQVCHEGHGQEESLPRQIGSAVMISQLNHIEKNNFDGRQQPFEAVIPE